VNLDRFDLNLLVAFEALMTEGQVTRAARRLHITQPALSSALARLRAAFNDQLFVKDGKSMRPTLRARELDPLIREALEKVRHAIGRPSFRPETAAVTVRIATSDDLELTLISKVLERLRSAAPGINLAIRRVSGVFELPSQELASGALDMAIGPFPQSPHHSTGVIVAALLYTDRLACVVREKHPKIKRTLSPAQFLEASHVVVYYPPGGVGIVDQLLIQRGAQRTQDRNDSAALHHRRVRGRADGSDRHDGSRVAEYLRRPAGVCVLAFPFESPKMNYGLYWHGRQTADPAHTWLREVIIDAAKEGNRRR
jgi:DNA-binding transcriptional LysR family regulator